MISVCLLIPLLQGHGLGQLLIVQVEIDVHGLKQEPGAGMGPVSQVKPLVHKFGGHHLEVDHMPSSLLGRPPPSRVQLSHVGVLIQMQVKLPSLAVHAVRRSCCVEDVDWRARCQILQSKDPLVSHQGLSCS